MQMPFAGTAWTTFSPKRTAGPASAAVASHKLTPLERSQLLAIYRYTEGNFGRAQADKYHAGFHRIFGLIAKDTILWAGVWRL